MKGHIGAWAIAVGLAAWTAGAGQAGNLSVRVDAAVTARAEEFITLRHDLHQHPELSGTEARTAGIVAERLRAFGLDVRTGVGGHGVVGLLRGGRPGLIVAYRADMDAVPSRDPDPVSFASKVPGVRHQCGHDVHVAVGLALAAALSSVRDTLPGSVLFVFQPVEARRSPSAATAGQARLATLWVEASTSRAIGATAHRGCPEGGHGNPRRPEPPSDG